MKKIDLSGERFDYFDLSEGYLFFDHFSQGEKFKMKVRGATLMHQLEIAKCDVYIPSMADLVFEDVAYIDIFYGLYANESGSEFVTNIDGTSTEMWLKLGKKPKLNDYKEYVIGGILGRNMGYGELYIYCRGKIILLYDEETIIDATDYCLSPQKFNVF